MHRHGETDVVISMRRTHFEVYGLIGLVSVILHTCKSILYVFGGTKDKVPLLVNTAVTIIVISFAVLCQKLILLKDISSLIL